MITLTRLTHSQKTLLAIVGMPLLVMLIGLWQMGRAPGSGAVSAEMQHAREVFDGLSRLQAGQARTAVAIDGVMYSLPLPGQMPQLDEVNRRNGQIVAVRAPDGRMQNVQILIGQARAAMSAQEDAFKWGGYLRWLAAGAFFLALAGVASGAAFLAQIRSMGRKARKSRAELLASFQKGKELLPWYLGTIGVLFLLAICCATGFEVVRLIEHGLSSRNDARLVFGGAALILILLYMGLHLVWKLFQNSRAAFRIEPGEVRGRAVSRQEAPRLWDFVREIAARVQAEMPDTIVAGLDECFYVTEAPVRLAGGQPLPPGRTLYLPLPYMAFMSKPEVAAVIGHELAHFTGDDTEYSLRFAPIYAHAVENLATVHELGGREEYWQLLTKPIMTLGVFFLKSFDDAVKHWSRIRELAADAMGARVAGREAAALALIRVSVLAPRIDEALANCWRGGDKGGGGVLAEARRLVQEKGLDDPKDHLESEQAHPTDTHPTTRQRLEAMGVPVNEQILAFARQARGGLLQDLGLEGGGQPGAAAQAPVSAALEAEFSATAEDERTERLAHLKELAALGMKRLTLREGGLIVGVLAAFAGPVLVAFPIMASDMPTGAKWMFWLLGPIVAAIGVAVLLRQGTAFITLTREGALFAGLKKPVPWTAIADISAQASTGNGKYGGYLTLHLADGFAPEPFSGGQRVKYKPKQHAITFHLVAVKHPEGSGSLTMEDLVDLIASYWQGGLARAELADYGMRTQAAYAPPAARPGGNRCGYRSTHRQSA